MVKETRSYKQIRQALFSGQSTTLEIVKQYLERIEEHRNLNCFLEVFGAEARERAALIDRKIADGTAGKLAGMVIAIKDNICYQGHKCSASSRILEGFQSLYSATVVERLIREDAIIIGRTNCDEFAMGSSNENSAYGPVKNPIDTTLVPGGSSGGSAAAVAANLCTAALGSDTGGSIRQPAAFSDVVGFKPSYGRVSRYGLIAFASSFDQIGPFTNNIEDAALLMEVMAGPDNKDSTASSHPVPEYINELEWQGKVDLALLQECMEAEGLDPEIKEAFTQLVEMLKADGNTATSETFPYLEQVVPAYYVLSTAEASSNLARYAGMIYGYQAEGASNLEETIVRSRSEGFGKEVQRRIMVGTFVLSEGYYDAYYGQAQKVRRLIRDHAESLLQDSEFIVLPTSPGPPFRLGDKTLDPVAMYLADIFTVQASLAGLPAISIPAGKLKNGLPWGLQIIGRNFEEHRLLAFSQYIMKKI
ncbi:MAG: Asp-tRNA(Asn)/Glu-tRNA(Gln) amidotransferase subunit GatA [Bacteroidia bacterium]